MKIKLRKIQPIPKYLGIKFTNVKSTTSSDDAIYEVMKFNGETKTYTLQIVGRPSFLEATYTEADIDAYLRRNFKIVE